MINSFLEHAGGYLDKALDVASGAITAASDEYQRALRDADGIRPVRANLIAIDVPDDDRVFHVSEHLNSAFADRMLIFNMSERRCNASLFKAEVIDVCFRGLPAPPVEMMVELCLSAHRWIESDPTHVIIVHCFKGFTRTIVFMSCFMAFRGVHPHPADALIEVCKRLGMSEDAINPSQRRYLTYFHECLQGHISPRCVRVRIVRATMNNILISDSSGFFFVLPIP